MKRLKVWMSLTWRSKVLIPEEETDGDSSYQDQEGGDHFLGGWGALKNICVNHKRMVEWWSHMFYSIKPIKSLQMSVWLFHIIIRLKLSSIIVFQSYRGLDEGLELIHSNLNIWREDLHTIRIFLLMKNHIRSPAKTTFSPRLLPSTNFLEVRLKTGSDDKISLLSAVCGSIIRI